MLARQVGQTRVGGEARFEKVRRRYEFKRLPIAAFSIRGTQMINYELLRDEGILIIRPTGSLEAADFQKIAEEVDPYIEAHGKLHGVMIDAPAFPGWKDFAAVVAHLRFVKGHHQKVEKIAAVSDSSFL